MAHQDSEEIQILLS